eukprot:TRINITY_DN17966_c0_g1_i2.p1 TRINITY_DN17966_c0_g1~~TRINITY_DN17966_c0_g1_i2.p1  ORF type:complete len:377 (+),score=36.64 TRINITY_DN17966_c0_g1_i2:65-1195(+)
MSLVQQLSPLQNSMSLSSGSGMMGGSSKGNTPSQSPRESRGPSVRVVARYAMDVRVGNKFRILEKLGAGSFGEIFKGRNIQTGELVAVKLEPINTKHPMLLPEARLYKMLGPDGPRGTKCNVRDAGIPRVHWYGLEGDFNVMVMDLLGPSLEDVFSFFNKSFSLKTILHLGIQMTSRIEYIHSKHMVHRDVKPDNFLLGVGSKASLVYAIDFGLAKPYRDPKTLEHISYRSQKHLLGTARYASLNTHLGVEQSRRDDIEAVGYILLYFLRGCLPWQGIKVQRGGNRKGETKEKHRIVKDMKVAITPEQLGKGYPPEFATFLKQSRNIRFNNKPNYEYFRNLLIDVRTREGIADDGVLEWTPSKGNPTMEGKDSPKG